MPSERASLMFPSYYWDKDRKILFRDFLESKHLLWSGKFRGTSAFNQTIFNQYKNEALKIGFKYKGIRYWTNIETFNKHAELINYQEPQLALELFFWNEEKI